MAWTVAQEGVSSVILGASRLGQLQENLASLTITIDDDLSRKLDKLFPPTEDA